MRTILSVYRFDGKETWVVINVKISEKHEKISAKYDN